MPVRKAIDFTKVELGDGALVENEVSIEFTRLKNPLLSMNVNSIKNEGNATCTILATVDNSQVEQGFFARELGVFAKVGNDGEEQLFAYTNAGNYADYTPDKNSTLDEKQVAINLAVGNASSVTAIIGSAQYATLENLQSHNDAEDSHPDIRQKITNDIATHNSLAAAHPAMDFIKSLSVASDGLRYRTRNGESDQVLDIINQIQTTLTQGTVPSGNNGTLFSLLSGIVHQIKALSGKTNWWETPKDSFETLSAGIVAGDVSDTNAWWVKFGGTIPLIIKGDIPIIVAMTSFSR